MPNAFTLSSTLVQCPLAIKKTSKIRFHLVEKGLEKGEDGGRISTTAFDAAEQRIDSVSVAPHALQRAWIQARSVSAIVHGGDELELIRRRPMRDGGIFVLRQRSHTQLRRFVGIVLP